MWKVEMRKVEMRSVEMRNVEMRSEEMRSDEKRHDGRQKVENYIEETNSLVIQDIMLNSFKCHMEHTITRL